MTHANEGVDPFGPRLRVAQIWRGEIMDERIVGLEAPVTLGGHGGTTFTTPDLGLPPTFQILRPTDRGWLLTLGTGMAGKLNLGGRQQGVREVAASGVGDGEHVDGAAGSFRAVAVAPGDWGIVHVDGVGDHTIFFQFVPAEARLPKPLFDDWELLLPAFLFAIICVGTLYAMVRSVYDPDAKYSVVFPREALTQYLVVRPAGAAEQPPEEKVEEPQAGTDDGAEDAKPASASGEAGKSGGEGDRPRLRDPDAGDMPSSTDAIRRSVRQRGLLQHGDKLAQIGRGMNSNRVGNAMARLKGPANNGGDGYGTGTGTGVGPGRNGTGTLTRGGGDGPGGGGTAHADIVTQDKIDTGGTRPPRGVAGGKGPSEVKVTVGAGTPDGDFGDLTAEQILKVVMARKSMFQACFERELQRIPNLSGTITVTWRIDGTGTVTMSKLKSSTMNNAAVEGCIVRRVRDLKFPPPSGGNQAIVNFPFVFAPRR